MIVVDTHALVWFIEGQAKLGSAARGQIERARVEGGVLIAAMSVWELAFVAHRRRIELSLDVRAWIDLVLALPGFELAPLEPAIGIAAAELAWEHRDPADRVIVATAIVRDVALLTADEKIIAYAAEGHLHAIDARR